MSHPGNFSEHPNKGQGAQDLARDIVSSLGIRPASDSERIRILREALEDNLQAWEGEEESVREEHADLIEETRAALEATKEGA